ncbi:MAG: hypothetical protein HC915_05195 [Anaerolineae bacterium]|nr:hypothetical protein [Anaerolineae bacterium]
MSFLKKLSQTLFGGSAGQPSGADSDGIYLYVRVKRTGEVVQVRLHRGNDLARDDDGQLFVRKVIMGTRSFERVEGTFFFNDRFQLINADLSGGELASEADYRAQQASA